MNYANQVRIDPSLVHTNQNTLSVPHILLATNPDDSPHLPSLASTIPNWKIRRSKPNTD